MIPGTRIHVGIVRYVQTMSYSTLPRLRRFANSISTHSINCHAIRRSTKRSPRYMPLILPQHYLSHEASTLSKCLKITSFSMSRLWHAVAGLLVNYRPSCHNTDEPKGLGKQVTYYCTKGKGELAKGRISPLYIYTRIRLRSVPSTMFHSQWQKSTHNIHT